MITFAVAKIVCELYTHNQCIYCSLAFVSKGWERADKQVQLSLWTRCPQDGKILRRWKSRRLSGGFWRSPYVQTSWALPSRWDNQQWKRVRGVPRTYTEVSRYVSWIEKS